MFLQNDYLSLVNQKKTVSKQVLSCNLFYFLIIKFQNILQKRLKKYKRTKQRKKAFKIVSVSYSYF